MSEHALLSRKVKDQLDVVQSSRPADTLERSGTVAGCACAARFSWVLLWSAHWARAHSPPVRFAANRRNTWIYRLVTVHPAHGTVFLRTGVHRPAVGGCPGPGVIVWWRWPLAGRLPRRVGAAIRWCGVLPGARARTNGFGERANAPMAWLTGWLS